MFQNKLNKTRSAWLQKMVLVSIGLLTAFTSAKAASKLEKLSTVGEPTKESVHVTFGNAPKFIDFSTTKQVVLDFRSGLMTDKPIVVMANEDSIALDRLEPVVITLEDPVSLTIKLKQDGKVVETMSAKVLRKAPLIKNDAVVFGILMLCLAFVFFTSTSKRKGWAKFYTFVPALLMCYLLPSILVSMGLMNSEISNTYSVAKNYFLPTALVLMTLSIDFKGVIRLGSKSLIMFLTATVGIILGGPIAILLVSTFSPETVGGAGPEAVWRGLATLAGSWIGGGANQTAMLEIYGYAQSKYGGMVLVDIVVANLLMAVLLYGAGKADKIDKWLKADSSAIKSLQDKMENYSKSITKNPSLRDLMLVLGVGFFITAVSHLVSKAATSYFATTSLSESVLTSSFFWIVVMATTLGLIMSFTKLRSLEGYGASKLGSVFIYILVATIGMKMDITQILENPLLILVGLIWMAFHAGLLLLVAKLIKAPFFFLAVGSQANVGGAASAPVVAAAFHPSLAPVGVLLAVLGYALGTYGAMFCTYLMQMVSP